MKVDFLRKEGAYSKVGGGGEDKRQVRIGESNPGYILYVWARVVKI